jgi:Transcription elongation factor, GreA/GreB, C-term/Histidine kinase-, DNA gyrase B-, and HSP90-like ATPase
LFDKDRIVVEDNAPGISFTTAEKEVFRFGHSAAHNESRDRLSVYGIGMKRALFKVGKRISMTSDHKSGGFGLTLDVAKWARSTKLPWTIPISKRPPASVTGTRIKITHLNPEIRERLLDKTFGKNLIEKISRVYSFFIGRIVDVYVNGERVARTDSEIGHENYSHDKFTRNGKTQSFQIIGEDEADPARGLVSWRSPLAQAVMGAEAGDEIAMEKPKGEIVVVKVEN